MPTAASRVAAQTMSIEDEPVGGSAPGPEGVEVTVTVNDDDAVSPAPSVAVQVTVVMPTSNAVPDPGEQRPRGAVASASHRARVRGQMLTSQLGRVSPKSVPFESPGHPYG